MGARQRNLGWARWDYVVGKENSKGRELELEQERRQGHLISLVGAGSDSSSGKGMSSPVRDSEPGIAWIRCNGLDDSEVLLSSVCD
jgi:hypothetical protein